MPLAKKVFAVRRKNSGGEVFPTDDEPAGMAMGRVISLAGRSLSTAVRHADARSLAVPVPRGTKIPSNRQPTIDTVSPPRATDSCVAGAFATTSSPVRIIRLRKGLATVYAFALRLRIPVKKIWSDARPVPRSRRTRESGRHRRKPGSTRRTPWQVHGRDDNSCACFEKSSGSASGRAGDSFRTIRGGWIGANQLKARRVNLGILGKPSKILLFWPSGRDRR